MSSAPREDALPLSKRRRLHRGPDRRTLLRGCLLAGLGAVGLTAAAPLFTGTARADAFYSLDGDTYLCQQNWWYCHICYSLFYSASGAGTGACAGETNQTAHSPLTPANGGDNYLMAHDHSNDKPSQVQVGWQWCDKCQGLYWGSAQSASMCAYDGMHHHTPAGTYVYDMPIAPLTTPPEPADGMAVLRLLPGVVLRPRRRYRRCLHCERLRIRPAPASPGHRRHRLRPHGHLTVPARRGCAAWMRG